MQFINDNLTVILMALLSLSEVLALVPSIKANSIFQLVIGIAKSFLESKKK